MTEQIRARMRALEVERKTQFVGSLADGLYRALVVELYLQGLGEFFPVPIPQGVTVDERLVGAHIEAAIEEAALWPYLFGTAS